MKPLFLFLFSLWAVAESISVSAQEKSPYPDLSLRIGNQQKTYAQIGLLGHTSRLYGGAIGILGHYSHYETKGVQTGLWTITKGKVQGLQLSPLFNYSESIRGVQLGSFANITSSSANGTQISATNLAIEGKGLAQIGLTNVILNEGRGLQIGITNYAGSMNGLQMGLINIAGGTQLRGLQIGLVNMSRDTSAIKIGLVNINPKTKIQMMVYGGNLSKINGAVRFRNAHFYTMLGVGIYNKGLNDKFSGTLFYRAGLHYPLYNKWRIGSDLGFAHQENSEASTQYETQRSFALQARLNIEYQFSPKFGAFISGGHSISKVYRKEDHFKHKPIIEAGILLF